MRIVYEEWLDGFVVVDDEAYLPADYDRIAKTCPVCRRRFLVIADGLHGRSIRYCSDGCRRASRRVAHRRRAA